MADKPIMFTGPMIRALLEGRKTQTRRVLKLPTKGEYVRPDMGGWEASTVGGKGAYYADGSPAPERACVWNQTTGTVIVPPIAVGGRLWVKETWSFAAEHCWSIRDIQRLRTLVPYELFYRATCEAKTIDGWCSPLFMPRWASRLTLTVTDVRVQRLQDISEADAIAEDCKGRLGPNPDFPDEWDPSSVERYRILWNSINDQKHPWSTNPWVAAYTFTVQQGNIDQVQS